jgi:hypothetical protein
VVFSVSFGLAPGPVASLPRRIRNPFGLEGLPWLSDAANFGFPLLTLCILASVVSLVLRYRRSREEGREQIKWIAFATSVVGALFLIGMVISLIYGSEPPPWTRLLDGVTAMSYTGVPIAVGFAVLKYRLYDIDLLINRTLVYGTLTGTLALVYFGGVAAAEVILRALTGQEQQPQLAIVVSTLVIAALFNPLRKPRGRCGRRFRRDRPILARLRLLRPSAAWRGRAHPRDVGTPHDRRAGIRALRGPRWGYHTGNCISLKNNLGWLKGR